jgi:hypothetical protein
MLGTAAEYWDSWWLRGVALTAGTYMSASLVYHDQHFVSDVLWGGAMGYAVATWVVDRHTSARHRHATSAAVPGLYVVPGAAGVAGATLVFEH